MELRHGGMTIGKQESAKEKKFLKKNVTKDHTEYQRELMLRHFRDDRMDLVEGVKRGLLNREMRRQDAKIARKIEKLMKSYAQPLFA